MIRHPAAPKETWAFNSRINYDPATIMMVGAGINVASSVMGGEAAMAAGHYQNTMADRNAGILDDKADQSAKLGEFNVKRFDRDFALQQASTEAAYMAAGVRMAGTPLEILEYNLAEAEMEKANIRYSSKVDSYDYKQQAVLARMQGQMALFQARSQRSAAWISAAGTMVGMYGSMAMVNQQALQSTTLINTQAANAKAIINSSAANNKLIVDTMNINSKNLMSLTSDLNQNITILSNQNRNLLAQSGGWK